MKIEYDKDVDAAYIYLSYPIRSGESKKTKEFDGRFIFDFDDKDKLLGIEVLSASKVLDKKLLSGAIQLSKTDLKKYSKKFRGFLGKMGGAYVLEGLRDKNDRF